MKSQSFVGEQVLHRIAVDHLWIMRAWPDLKGRFGWSFVRLSQMHFRFFTHNPGSRRRPLANTSRCS